MVSGQAQATAYQLFHRSKVFLLSSISFGLWVVWDHWYIYSSAKGNRSKAMRWKQGRRAMKPNGGLLLFSLVTL